MVQEGVDLNKHVKNSNSFLKGRFKMMLCFMESSQKEDRNFSDSGVIAFFLSLEVFNRGSMPILKNIFEGNVYAGWKLHYMAFFFFHIFIGV